MHYQNNLVLLLLSGLVAQQVQAVDRTVNATPDASLITAATQFDRMNILSEQADWTFDFTKQPLYATDPGSVVNANFATFPATGASSQGMTMALITLALCAILPLHHHPRASNYVVAMTGNTTTYMIEENGAQVVRVDLEPGKMTIFPRCIDAYYASSGSVLVSALSSNDADTLNVVNNLYNLPSNIISAAYGNPDGGVKMDYTIPAVGTGAIRGDDTCLKQCGLS